jgi:hypothetical protein
VPIDSPAKGRLFGEHERTRDDFWPPAEPLLDDDRREPDLGVEDAVGLFEGPDGCLDLEHKSDSQIGPQRENVNGSSLAELREGNLSVDVPATRLQQRNLTLDERGMAPIQKLVRCRSIPPRCQAQPTTFGLEDPSNPSELYLSGAAGLDMFHVGQRYLRG